MTRRRIQPYQPIAWVRDRVYSHSLLDRISACGRYRAFHQQVTDGNRTWTAMLVYDREGRGPVLKDGLRTRDDAEKICHDHANGDFRLDFGEEKKYLGWRRTHPMREQRGRPRVRAAEETRKRIKLSPTPAQCATLEAAFASTAQGRETFSTFCLRTLMQALEPR